MSNKPGNTSPLNGGPGKGDFSQESLNAMLLEIMQTMYPNSQTYQDGNLLFDPVPQTSPVQTAAEGDKTADGAYEVPTNSPNVQSKHIKIKSVHSIEPAVDSDIIDDLIDDTFVYFDEDEEVGGITPAEPEHDVFISLQPITTNDLHDMYLRFGPQINVNEDMFCVLYIERGKARPIPNYETLEVMLVERSIDYDSITTLTEEQALTYGIDSIESCTRNVTQYEINRIQDRQGEWGQMIRYKSGYRPVAPFERDPGDYYNTTMIDPNFGTPYEPNVYETQTSLEKLRETFEGKMIVNDVTYRGENDEGKDPGDIINADIDSVRILTQGFWKWPIDLGTYAYYNILNEYSVDAPTENWHINWLNNFNKVGAVTVLSADLSSAAPVWNDFAHIAGVNTLDPEEYNEYFTAMNAGKPFELEYLMPYEPPGSVKYYSAGTTSQLAFEALQDVGSLQDQVQEQETLDNLRVQIEEDLNSLVGDIDSKLASLEGTYFDQFVAVNEVKTRATSLGRDLINMLHHDMDGSANDYWKIKKKWFGNWNVKTKQKGFWKACQEGLKNSKQKTILDGLASAFGEPLCVAPITPDPGSSKLFIARDVTDDTALNEAMQTAWDVVESMIMNITTSLTTNSGMSNMPGGGAATQEMLNGLQSALDNIEQGWDDFWESFDYIGLDFSGAYTSRKKLAKQITSFEVEDATWGSMTNRQHFITTIINQYNVNYYNSDVYGRITAFDQTVEEVLQADNFEDRKNIAIASLNSLRSDVVGFRDQLEDLGQMATPDQVAEKQTQYDDSLALFNTIRDDIPIANADTMYAQMDILRMLWVARIHNYINVMRKTLNTKYAKWMIRYSNITRTIVETTFPHTAGNREGYFEGYGLINPYNLSNEYDAENLLVIGENASGDDSSEIGGYGGFDDLDGDGILNNEDDDVDGDGISNSPDWGDGGNNNSMSGGGGGGYS